MAKMTGPLTATGDGLKEAWKAPSAGSGPCGGGYIPMPKGDGLGKAWANQTAKPSVRIDMKAARMKVR